MIDDNIDKIAHRSFQRLNYNTQSLHYFRTYDLLDRVDGLSDEPPKKEINFNTLLPNDEDICKLKDSFVVLVARLELSIESINMYVHFSQSSCKPFACTGWITC